LEPRTLRSLDAIHLASALSLGADLGSIVTYDSNMATAAAGYGLEVLAPKATPSE
jgi:predicted nucleic acid-binding protein